MQMITACRLETSAASRYPVEPRMSLRLGSVECGKYPVELRMLVPC